MVAEIAGVHQEPVLVHLLVDPELRVAEDRPPEQVVGVPGQSQGELVHQEGGAGAGVAVPCVGEQQPLPLLLSVSPLSPPQQTGLRVIILILAVAVITEYLIVLGNILLWIHLHQESDLKTKDIA